MIYAEQGVKKYPGLSLVLDFQSLPTVLGSLRNSASEPHRSPYFSSSIVLSGAWYARHAFGSCTLTGGGNEPAVGHCGFEKGTSTRVDRAIAALDEIASNGGPAGRDRRARSKGVATARSSTKRHLTAAGRKRLSDLMKRRWAERRREKRDKRP